MGHMCWKRLPPPCHWPYPSDRGCDHPLQVHSWEKLVLVGGQSTNQQDLVYKNPRLAKKSRLVCQDVLRAAYFWQPLRKLWRGGLKEPQHMGTEVRWGGGGEVMQSGESSCAAGDLGLVSCSLPLRHSALGVRKWFVSFEGGGRGCSLVRSFRSFRF